MPLQIEIQKEHINDLITFYTEKQKEVKQRISELEREYSDIIAIIMQLRQSSLKDASKEIVPIEGQDIYSPKWTWVKKISFALKQVAKPLTANEIVDIISEYEYEFKIERRKAIASVSSTLSVKAGKEFIKEKGVTGEFEYSLPGKFNNNSTKEKFGTKILIDELPF